MDIAEENVKVVVRIRPMQTEEKKSGDIPCVKAVNDGNEVQVKVGPLDAQVYRCNRCFNPETNQLDFFAESGITDLLDSAIQGYRACAFAFGQTGAGKTHTMIGSSKGISSRDKNVGLIPRSLDYLYEKLSQLSIQFKIKLSCLEIYHEHVYDLFADDKERTPMQVREHNVEGFFLEGARLVDCNSYSIACSVLDVAFKNRQVGFHDLNSRSSRSHCMTEVYIETFPNPDENPDQIVRGKMSLVDLAGSERLKSTNSTGKVLQEAGFINRSLYVLGKVIAGLVRTNGDLNHKDVPYRDSKLTKLLISSLGGSSRTLMISCVSEAKGSQAETLRTLKFSMSCARIRNKPVRFLDPQEKLIVDLKDEIKRLRQENQALRSNLLTAPSSSTDSLHAFGGGRGDENSPHRMRAHSAQSGMSPAGAAAKKHPRNSPDKLRRGGGGGQGGSMTKRKTKIGQTGASNQAGFRKTHQKTNKKKPEIFYKYPQLAKILNDDNDSVASTSSHGGAAAGVMMMAASPNRGRIRPSAKNIVHHPPTHQHAPQYGDQAVDFNAGDNMGSASMMMMMGDDNDRLLYPSDPAQGSYNSADPYDAGHQQATNNSPNKRRSHEILDEMVHRRAPGPMIFKDVQNAPYEPLRDSRLNKYYPAENLLKSMDQRKIEVLEQRIARMEAQQKRLEQARGGDTKDEIAVNKRNNSINSNNPSIEDGYYSAAHPGQPTNACDDEATIQNAIAIDGSELVKAGKQKNSKRKVPQAKKKKEKQGVSPYISHLDTNKLQVFQQELNNEPKLKANAPLSNVSLPSKKQVNKRPDGVHSNAVALSVVAPPRDAAAGSSKPSMSEVRSSIDKELEELGLSDILGGKPQSSMPPKSQFASVIAAATNSNNKNSNPVAQSKSTPNIETSNNQKKKSKSNTNQNNQQSNAPNKSQSLPQIHTKQQQVDGGALISAAAAASNNNNMKKRGSKDHSSSRGGSRGNNVSAAIDASSATPKLPVIARPNSVGDKKLSSPEKQTAQKEMTPVKGNAGARLSNDYTQKSPGQSQPQQQYVSPNAGKKTSQQASPAIANHHDTEYEDDDDFMPPTPDRLKEKLHALEASLVSKRIEMEDNPGDVTSDIEEKFKNLQLETLVIKQQLSEITGEDFPSEGHSNESRNYSAASNRDESSNTADIVKASPGKKSGKEKTTADDNYDDDDDYGDEDFENEEANSNSSSPVAAARKDMVSSSPPPAAVVKETAQQISPTASPKHSISESNKSSSPAKSIAQQEEKEKEDDRLVEKPMVLSPAKNESFRDEKASSSPEVESSAKAEMVEAHSEDQGYEEDDYDVDFEAADDEDNDRRSPVKTAASIQPSNATSSEAEPPLMNSNPPAASTTVAVSNKEIEQSTPVEVSSPAKRVKTPAGKSPKTPGDDDDEGYGDDGFDDYDVSFEDS